MSAYAQPTHLICGVVKDISNKFHPTTNRVRRCCVGGDMTILIFGSFQKHGGFYKDLVLNLLWPTKIFEKNS